MVSQGEESTKIKASDGLDISDDRNFLCRGTADAYANLLQIEVVKIFLLECAWDGGKIRSDCGEVVVPGKANRRLEEAFRALHTSQVDGCELGRVRISEMEDGYNCGT